MCLLKIKPYHEAKSVSPGRINLSDRRQSSSFHFLTKYVILDEDISSDMYIKRKPENVFMMTSEGKKKHIYIYI